MKLLDQYNNNKQTMSNMFKELTENIENGNQIEILEQENMTGEIQKNGCV